MTLVVSYNAWLQLLGFFALFSGSHSLDVKGELHKDVLLPCVVVYKDEFDYNILVVTWQRDENDIVVHSFFYGSSQPNYTDAHYKGRTKIFSELLPNGNASLLLRNLTESDAGTYICYVSLKQSSGHLTQNVNLTVYGSHSVDVEGELHKDVLLPCVVVYKDKFDYNMLAVTWQRNENDAVVHNFFNGSNHPEYQDAHYKGRTEIFNESLPNGNVSLLLRNLTESDAGTYICRMILKQSRRPLTQYVNLTVYDVPVAEWKNTTRILIVTLLPLLVVLVLTITAAVLLVRRYKSKKSKVKDEERQPLYEPTSDPTKEYRNTFKKTKYQDFFERQLIVAKENLFATCQSHNVHFTEQQKSINVKELFTPENKSLLSKRMLLVGTAGTGKSYFCKWLEEKWVRNEIELYKCIIYISRKKIQKNETSVKEIVEDKCEGLSGVLQTLNVLLILDELDDLVYDASVTNDDLKDDINTSLQLNTLIKSIINQQLFPDMDVLIVSRPDSPVTNLQSHFTSTFVLQELDDGEASNVYDSIGKILPDEYKSIKDIFHNPAFVSMLCMINRFPEIVKDFSSPYELLISFLQQYLNTLTGEAEDSIKQLAKESYQNLVKGKHKQLENTKHLHKFFKFFNCEPKLKYQYKFLRDMLAALHCVWEPKTEECLKDCIDFWLFGTSIGNKRSCPLLEPVVEEHHTKYYNFIRFFMRLLPYPDYKSLRSNTRNMDDNLQKFLRDYFRNIMKDHNDNYEKLAVVHCVFELHDDDVTVALSSTEQFCLVNTPLNSLDIRALVYCFRNARLQKLDLRLCALTDQNVEGLKSIIMNSDYVLLSSNRLTSRTGIFLEKLLKEPQCPLKRLSLGTNNLGPDGAQALWRALEHNTMLKNLYLYDNNIGDEGTDGMVEHLLNNNSLEQLHLCQNSFGEDVIKKIKMLKAKKTQLKVVMTIPEDLELFNYAEEKIQILPDTWRNYDQEWLIKLLEAVQADLQNKDWEMDARLTQDRVENLIMQIKNIMDTIKKESLK